MPSGSEEPEPSNETASPVTVSVKAATGGWLAAITVTEWVIELVAPWLSVTVSFTL